MVNLFKLEERIPQTWQQLMSWGSLRGALAIVMVLLIPDDMILPGWTFHFSIKDFVAALTIGCIYFTLLIKATTIGLIIRKLKIDELSPHEKLSYYKTKALIYQDKLGKLDELLGNKQISPDQYQALNVYYRALHDQHVEDSKRVFKDSSHVIEGMIRLYALGFEKAELKEIFRRGEISESIYKQILNMLEIQIARVAQDKQQLTSINERFANWFYISFINFFRKILLLKPKKPSPEEVYIYYRTQCNLILKVIDELENFETSRLYEIFNDKEALANVLTVFKNLKARTEERMKDEININQFLLDRLNQRLAKSLLNETQSQALNELHGNEIITTKLFISLKKELNAEQ